MPKVSAFEVVEINYLHYVVALEDRELGLMINVPFAKKELVSVEIVEPYAILLCYGDGTREKKVFLE